MPGKLDIHDDYHRPIDAIDFPTECPICLEALFDDQGKTTTSKGGVAKIMCPHLVHSECLKEAGKALNSDGERYGMGGLQQQQQQPRAGCPVCSEPVSTWEVYKRADEFPIFWMHRIQKCLEITGPSNGPIPVALVQKMLNSTSSDDDDGVDRADDASTLPRLTTAQKKEIFNKDATAVGTERRGFSGALQGGNSVWVNRVVDGGPSNGGYIVSGFEKGIWDYNNMLETLWLGKWGKWPPPTTTFSLFRAGILPVLCAIFIGYLYSIMFAQVR